MWRACGWVNEWVGFSAGDFREHFLGCIEITEPSGAHGENVLLRELQEELASILVEGALAAFNYGPLVMTRHGSACV